MIDSSRVHFIPHSEWRFETKYDSKQENSNYSKENKAKSSDPQGSESEVSSSEEKGSEGRWIKSTSTPNKYAFNFTHNSLLFHPLFLST